MTAWPQPDPDEADTLRQKTEALMAALDKPELKNLAGLIDIQDSEGQHWIFDQPGVKLARSYVWGVFNGLEPTEASYRAMFPIYSSEEPLASVPKGIRSCVEAICKLVEGARINIPVRDRMATGEGNR